MRVRESARLLVISPHRRVLLFRFVHTKGPLAGDNYWASPGGGLEPGETFQAAAQRELKEETGFETAVPEQHVLTREFPLRLPDGETVVAHERYFAVHVDNEDVSRQGWSQQEIDVMADHRWWSSQALRDCTDIIYPEGLLDFLETNGYF